MPRSAARSSFSVFAVVILAALILGLPGRARAGGEARNLTRDPDRVYTVVAGEADASAVVQNAANLGYLRGIAGIFDISANSRESGHRGSGAGIFLGIPLPWELFSFGAGLQYSWRLHQACGAVDPAVDPDPTCKDDYWILAPDERFGKFSLAFALPLMRWLPGVSIGMTYSRAFSRVNLMAAEMNQVDVGVSFRASRYIGLGLVGRALNQPRMGKAAGGDTEVVAPLTLDPELALRPLGSSKLEIGVGARISMADRVDGPLIPFPFQPRGRVLISLDGARVFAEVERVAYEVENDLQPTFDAVNGLRMSVGLEFNTPHFGIAGGGNFLAGTGAGAYDGLQGGSARLRLSRERYLDVPRVRPRSVTRLVLGEHPGELGMATVVRTIDELDSRGARTILIETRGMLYSFPEAEEVREAIVRFRTHGGQVVVYVQGASLSSYFLASAADRIISHPSEGLSITGLSLRTLYFGELLAKIGVRSEFVRIAEYKGTPEVYSRDSASDPVREDRQRRLGDVWNHILRLIARERGHDPLEVSEWIDGAPHSPEQARLLGIVDELAYRDELDARLESWLGKPIRLEALPEAPLQANALGPAPHVAVLHIEGDLVAGESLTIPLIGRKLAGSKTLVAEIERLADDRLVKAVVVRIDSPGGSVAAAEDIARQLDLLADEKPVVVSLGSVAASGGYYVATAGSYIFTDATTLTGSIGIFYPKLDLSQLLERIGVGVDITSLGANAAMRSWFKPYAPGEREAAMRAIQDSYDVFVARVAEARNLRPAQVDEVARGRVFSGVRAIEVGLADEYGGLREAVVRAHRMAGMRRSDRLVIDYPARPRLLQQIRRLFGLRLSLPIGAEAGPKGVVMGIFDPILRVLRELPAALWVADLPEPMALDIAADVIE